VCGDTAFLIARARSLCGMTPPAGGSDGMDHRVIVLAALLAYDGMCLSCVADRAGLGPAETARILDEMERSHVIGKDVDLCTTCPSDGERSSVYGVRGTSRFPFTAPVERPPLPRVPDAPRRASSREPTERS
jgi:hypothetical protein